MDDLTPEQALKQAEDMQGTDEQEFNPFKSPEVISIIQQKDGNWKLWGQRFGKMISLRGVKPEDVLSEFLTHA